MKKILLTFFIGLMVALVSCGPSAEQIEEKRIADSIRVADSLIMIQIEERRIADSIANAIAIQCKEDSIKNCCKKIK